MSCNRKNCYKNEDEFIITNTGGTYPPGSPNPRDPDVCEGLSKEDMGRGGSTGACFGCANLSSGDENIAGLCTCCRDAKRKGILSGSDAADECNSKCQPNSIGSSNHCKKTSGGCYCCDDSDYSGDNIACGPSKGNMSCNVSCEEDGGDFPKCKSGSNNIKQRKRKVGGNGGNGPGSSPQPSPSASSQDWFAKHKALVLGLSIGIPVALIVLFLLYSFA